MRVIELEILLGGPSFPVKETKSCKIFIFSGLPLASKIFSSSPSQYIVIDLSRCQKSKFHAQGCTSVNGYIYI